MIVRPVVIQVKESGATLRFGSPSRLGEGRVGANLALGTALIGTTVIVHTIGLIVLTRVVADTLERWRLFHHAVGRTLTLVPGVFGLFFIMTIEVWTWAGAYFAIGVTDTFPDALYFSTVTFSTLGYGDIVPPEGWQLLCGLEGINGFLLIGWSTAYLVAASTRHGPFRAGEHF